MNPPKFIGTKVEEDPQEFVDEMDKIFKVMHVDQIEDVELSAYQLKEVANQWYNEWEDAKGDSAEPTVWDEFVEAFLDRLFPLELREAKEEEFMNLKKGKMSVQEYTLKFNQLAHYAPEMTSSVRARMRKLTVHMQQIEEKKKKISEARKKERQAKRARSADQGYSQPQSDKWLVCSTLASYPYFTKSKAKLAMASREIENSLIDLNQDPREESSKCNDEGIGGYKSVSYKDLFMLPDINLPLGFKMTKLEKYAGHGDLVAHLRRYCNQLRAAGGREEFLMAFFGESLFDLASE
ncbi:uncharacterized protein LOC124896567 [Capsicum annuum]|uniref:uncharacterized protein LOC124896567 n=1 Tax=Capsicum annuum TaxID=4072 RepID=UPI001FB11DCC|nr:uncharacterized protein LOC124896567 [Capsicum annuum]